MERARGRVPQYSCLLNRLASAPTVFTKLLKQLFSHLRLQGHYCPGYIGDSLFLSDSFPGCQTTVPEAVNGFESLGFIVHPIEWVLSPTQTIDYLGFTIDSVLMTFRPTEAKVASVVRELENFRKYRTHQIREVARIVGLLVALLPGAKFGKLFYRRLEQDKIRALKSCHGNFEVTMLRVVIRGCDWVGF